MARHSPIVTDDKTSDSLVIEHERIVTRTVTKLPPGDPANLLKMTARKCDHCRVTFEAQGRARYCSDACKQSAYRGRMKAQTKRRQS